MDFKKMRRDAHIRGLLKTHAVLIDRIEKETTALLARHKKEKDRDDYELYLNSPVFFIYMDKVRETRIREINAKTDRLKGSVTTYKLDGYTKNYVYAELYSSKAALLESL